VFVDDEYARKQVHCEIMVTGKADTRTAIV